MLGELCNINLQTDKKGVDMSIIACCKFPTTLLVLDDDQDLLDNIQLALHGKYKCICVSDSDEAHNILNKNRDWTKSLLEKSVSQMHPEDDPTAISVRLKVSAFKNQVNSLDRFNHISTLIVDFDMPKKNGLEFVRELKDPQIKVIMLTGKASQETVIKAFNNEEIHRFVSKGDPDYLNTIFQYVNELESEFFFEFPKFILDSFRESNNTIFENKAFIDLFNKTVKDNNIIEYYLLDESGSFLMLDATTKSQIWFIVKSKDDIRHFYEMAQDEAEFPAETLKKLENNQVLTHFKSSKEHTAPAKSWHFVDAQILDEKNGLYYAIIKNDKNFQLEPSRIKSYQEFLNLDR